MTIRWFLFCSARNKWRFHHWCDSLIAYITLMNLTFAFFNLMAISFEQSVSTQRQKNAEEKKEIKKQKNKKLKSWNDEWHYVRCIKRQVYPPTFYSYRLISCGLVFFVYAKIRQPLNFIAAVFALITFSPRDTCIAVFSMKTKFVYMDDFCASLIVLKLY